MSIDNLYTSYVLADRLQRARREASERIHTREKRSASRIGLPSWRKLRHIVRRLA